MGKDIALFIMRLGFGLSMALGHGLGKIDKLGQEPVQFPALFGLSPKINLALAGGAEFFCALAVAAGFATRLASIPLVITMAVAFFLVHGADPFDRKELAFMYLLAFTSTFLMGPGKYSLDALLGNHRLNKRFGLD